MIFKSEQQIIPQVKPLVRKKAKREKLSRPGRLAVLGILLLSVTFSLAIYVRPELAKIKGKWLSPLIITSVSKEEQFNAQPVLDEIENLTGNLLGSYGVYVYRFQDGSEYGLRQNETFPAASLMKLPVMLLVYQEADKGNLKLADYREAVRAMAKRSDNVAYNKLVAFFGKEKIQGLITGLGMANTFMAKDDTTPADVGLIFKKLYRGNREEILDFLTDTLFEDRIPAGIPEGVRVAHKIGTEITSFSDAGIVYADSSAGGPFILVIMSKEAKESEASQVLPKIAKAVWEWETGDSGQ